MQTTQLSVLFYIFFVSSFAGKYSAKKRYPVIIHSHNTSGEWPHTESFLHEQKCLANQSIRRNHHQTKISANWMYRKSSLSFCSARLRFYWRISFVRRSLFSFIRSSLIAILCKFLAVFYGFWGNLCDHAEGQQPNKQQNNQHIKAALIDFDEFFRV